jgi:hypothetical protein
VSGNPPPFDGRFMPGHEFDVAAFEEQFKSCRSTANRGEPKENGAGDCGKVACRCIVLDAPVFADGTWCGRHPFFRMDAARKAGIPDLVPVHGPQALLEHPPQRGFTTEGQATIAISNPCEASCCPTTRTPAARKYKEACSTPRACPITSTVDRSSFSCPACPIPGTMICRAYRAISSSDNIAVRSSAVATRSRSSRSARP